MTEAAIGNFKIKRSAERGFASHGWLKSFHTFSFANYYDPANMGFRALRVINEDRIEGGTGFGAHPHRDMEIISYVVKGALEHQDSMGTKAIIRPGEVQRMSAGAGIVHSEINFMKDQETHFFQIWIQPDTKGGEPGYGQKSFEAELNSRKSVLVVSKDGREGSISIKRDADLTISRLNSGDTLDYSLRSGRGLWLQVVTGEISVNGNQLQTGDAISIEGLNSKGSFENLQIQIRAKLKSEFMIFDLD